MKTAASLRNAAVAKRCSDYFLASLFSAGAKFGDGAGAGAGAGAGLATAGGVGFGLGFSLPQAARATAATAAKSSDWFIFI
jgi:hypothetical protein